MQVVIVALNLLHFNYWVYFGVSSWGVLDKMLIGEPVELTSKTWRSIVHGTDLQIRIVNGMLPTLEPCLLYSGLINTGILEHSIPLMDCVFFFYVLFNNLEIVVIVIDGTPVCTLELP